MAPAGLFSEYAESQDILSQISGVLPHSCIDLTPGYLTDLTGQSSLQGVIARNNYTDIHVFDEESVVIRRSGRTTKVPSKYQQPDVAIHDSSSSRSSKSINHPGNNQVAAGEETNINYNNFNDKSEDNETYPRDLLYLCLMRSDFAKYLIREPQKKETDHPFTPTSIKNWILLLEKPLDFVIF